MAPPGRYMGALTGANVMIADSLMIFFAYSLVAARIWFRLFHQRLGFTLSDMFLLIACVQVLAILCIFVKELEMGVIKEDPEMTPLLLKLSFTTVLLYDSSLYILKFSILSFFNSIIPKGLSKLRIALYVCTGITVCFSITAPLLAVFWCGTEVSRMFARKPTCTFWDTKLFEVDWVLNMTSDVLILILPFPLLSKLVLSRRQIAGLAVTFGLGAITMVVSILRFVSVMNHKFLPLYVWSVAEICTGIMVVSLPALRPLLRRMGSGGTNSSKRRASSRIAPIQDAPSPGPSSMRFSKLEHRSRNGDPPDGYHYTYDSRSLGSDVELHGGLRSDNNSKTETIAVYTDAAEVLNHHPQSHPHRSQDARTWVQRTRQLG